MLKTLAQYWAEVGQQTTSLGGYMVAGAGHSSASHWRDAAHRHTLMFDGVQRLAGLSSNPAIVRRCLNNGATYPMLLQHWGNVRYSVSTLMLLHHILDTDFVMHSQKEVDAYFSSKQLLPYGFGRQMSFGQKTTSAQCMLSVVRRWYNVDWIFPCIISPAQPKSRQDDTFILSCIRGE